MPKTYSSSKFLLLGNTIESLFPKVWSLIGLMRFLIRQNVDGFEMNFILVPLVFFDFPTISYNQWAGDRFDPKGLPFSGSKQL